MDLSDSGLGGALCWSRAGRATPNILLLLIAKKEKDLFKMKGLARDRKVLSKRALCGKVSSG